MQKAEIINKISKALQASQFDSIIITGYDNIHYLSGVDLPFAAYRKDQPLFYIFRKDAEPVLICPAEWTKTAIFTGWVRNVIAYTSAGCFCEALINIASLLGGSEKIGIDFEYTSNSIFNSLKSVLPESEFVSCDDLIKEMRMVKCNTEKKMLEDVAMIADHGMNGAIHHVTVDRRTSALTLAEEFRVHTIERGIDIVGYHSSTGVLTGEGNDHYLTHTAHYGYAETIDLKPAEMVRMVVPGSKDGYWTDSVRIMTMGDMLESQEKSYNMLTALRDAAISAVKPGNTAADVYHAMAKYASDHSIPLQDDNDLGHGIGAALNEPPYINPCDDTVLAKDMVLVIAPVIKDEDGLLWIQKDTVIVTDDGCRIIGWYKDWREPYIPIASI